LGAWCMLNVVERQGNDGKMYVNVANISPVPAMIKQAGLPAAINKNEMFSLSEPDMEMFNTFSDSLKKKIQASPEWEKLQNKPKQTASAPALDDGLTDDDIPF